MTPEEIGACLRDQIDWLVGQRPAYAGFRTLCTLLNGYWGNWQRLIIIERPSWNAEADYRFVAAGVTDGAIKIVTNYPQVRFSQFMQPPRARRQRSSEYRELVP